MNYDDKDFVYQLIYEYSDEEFNSLLDKLDTTQIDAIFAIMKEMKQEMIDQEMEMLEEQVEESGLEDAKRVLECFRLK